MPTRGQKIFALAAIALLALNLRTAVSSISPVVGFIQEEFSLPIITIGLLGVAAPLAFALATSLAYRPARRMGVELTLIFVTAAIVLGHLLRAIAIDAAFLFAGSMLSLLAMGIGNVLLPVLVRKYFPNRIGQISAIYITLTSVSATIGSLFAVPVADLLGWRFSLGQWALLAILTLIPLLAIRSQSNPEPKLESNGARKAIWRSPTAIAIGGVQGMTSVFGYVSFAWLPLLLIEHNSATQLQAGSLLALFAIMGFPVSLIVPPLAQRYPKSQPLIVYFSATMGVLGSLGLLFSTNLVWLWVVFLGLGPTMFPLALTLFNLRSRERSTVLAVSSFGQGLSYSFATLMVLLVGITRELTGGWELALWLMFAVAALSALAGLQLQKGRQIEDELH